MFLLSIQNINIWSFWIRKTNSLFNLIIHQLDIDKDYLSAKDPYEVKQQVLINKKESIGLKNVNYSKAFSEYSEFLDNIYKNIDEYNLNKQRKILVVFNYMIADMLSNKKTNVIVTELFIRDRKLNVSLVLIIQSYFSAPKNTTKFYTLIYYKNSKQTRTSANLI